MKATLAAACLALLACPALAAPAHRSRQPAEPQKAPAWEKQFPTGATFVLAAVNGKPVPRGTEATLLIDGAYRGQGASGCNNWSATLWPMRGQRLVAGGFSLTRKSCPPATMAFERGYLSILATNATWDLVADELVVKSPRGTLNFRRGL